MSCCSRQLGNAQGLPLETAKMHPSTAHLMIINPLSRSGIAGMFSTYLPTAERIHRLLAMAA
jgi:heat shock protein HtpX